MGFMNAPSEGGDFKVYVSFNAKSGRWNTKEDKPDAQMFEVSDLTAVFDMDNLITGWFLFTPGVAPSKVFDPSLTQAAPKPGEGYKRGFQLDLFSQKNLLGVREFSSTAGVAIEAMNTLYDEWVAAAPANPGKLPVVKCMKVEPVTSKHGTNYRPVLKIVSWADRPTEMKGGASTPPAAAEPPKQAQQHTPPPAAAEAGDDVEF